MEPEPGPAASSQSASCPPVLFAKRTHDTYANQRYVRRIAGSIGHARLPDFFALVTAEARCGRMTRRRCSKKIWQRHAILTREDGQTLLYIEQSFSQDGSAPAFELLRQRGLKPRAPHRAFATPDHYIPTNKAAIWRPWRTREAGHGRGAAQRQPRPPASPFFGLNDARQGIVHVVAPEQGLSQPGTADRLRR